MVVMTLEDGVNCQSVVDMCTESDRLVKALLVAHFQSGQILLRCIPSLIRTDHQYKST